MGEKQLPAGGSNILPGGLLDAVSNEAGPATRAALECLGAALYRLDTHVLAVKNALEGCLDGRSDPPPVLLAAAACVTSGIKAVRLTVDGKTVIAGVAPGFDPQVVWDYIRRAAGA